MVGVLFNSCKSTKLVPDGKYLLVSNKIITKGSNQKNIVDKVVKTINNDMNLYIKHKPNRKILGVYRFHLRMYNFASSKKKPHKDSTKRWRSALKKSGEAPIILDENEIKKSENNLRNHFYSKGFFNVTVTHEIKYRKRKKAEVIYIVTTGQEFVIDTVFFLAEDEKLDNELNSISPNSILRKNEIVDLDNIAIERARITNHLRNIGYFDFNREFIQFELDTLRINNKVRVKVILLNKLNGDKFNKYKINQVNVNFSNESYTDLLQKIIWHDSIKYKLNGYPLNVAILSKNIDQRPGKYFSQNELEHTYNRLLEFQIFKLVDIQFEKNEFNKTLIVNINLRTSFTQSFTIEPQGIFSQINRLQTTTTNNSWGLANSLTWSHRNLFKGAELLSVSALTRAEIQAKNFDKTILYDRESFAIQQSISASLLIPKSFFLKKLENLSFVRSIKTSLNLSYLYENNPDYVRKILPLNYQYLIKTNKLNLFLNVAEVSFSRNNLKNVINLQGRKDSSFIKQTFSNNLVTSSGLSMIYTNQNQTKKRSFFMVRANLIELGGNTHRAIRYIFDSEKRKDTSYQLLKVNYFQYAKSEIDVRCSTNFSKKHSTSVRLNAGLAYPYTNQKILPFDKLFFIGGANSLRGWRPRTIGPGSFNDSNNFRIDRAGDVIFQSSIEYRFDVIGKFLELALFVDAGNVWISRKNINTLPQKVFEFDKFYKEFAANTGVGFRFDFEFFLFRLDWGWQILNPEKPENERFVGQKINKKGYIKDYTLLNFGIGYPF